MKAKTLTMTAEEVQILYFNQTGTTQEQRNLLTLALYKAYQKHNFNEYARINVNELEATSIRTDIPQCKIICLTDILIF